ncbi:plasmid replication initiator protein [Mycobacterium intracellulare subsp. chimaera]|uniref:replication initiator n=1 Tax=Mycobacterium intracellulare TaxID=1767 RepID=UPI000B8CD9CE|nr:replication initiator [Mycobacterium intracellulare]ASQ84643.1 plasmid replication initiator protein [Mycobacterium intracellulare subsp. chimaera]
MNAVTAESPVITLSGLPATVEAAPVIAQMLRRASSPGFPTWWRRVESVGYCAHPIQLSGADDTGRRHTVWTRCNNRRATVCPSCSDLYARDTWQLVHAGAAGGHHNVPVEVAARPQVFTTLTAPGYGGVHNAIGTVCHPKPSGSATRCRHGKPLRCTTIHAVDDPVVGQPLCRDCYDYLGHVLFTWHLPELWRRFTIALRRAISAHLKTLGVTAGAVRVSFVKVVELQARAIPHIHALIRLDPPPAATTGSADRDGYGPAAPWGGGEPRSVAGHDAGWSSPITATELAALIQRAARHVHIDVPAGDGNGDPGQGGVRTLRFGSQIDTQPLTHAIPTAATDSVNTVVSHLSPRRVAGYLAKYVTKSLHDFGITARRLSAEAIRDLQVSDHVRAILCTIAELAEHTGGAVAGIGRWLHTLGYRGHITTKSRHYSTTMGALRTTRATWTRQQMTETTQRRNATQPVHPPADVTATPGRRREPVDPDAVAWEFDHAGHASAGDRVLVISAALRHITARITAITETRTLTARPRPAPPGACDG